MNSIIETIKTRRSVRAYRPGPVEKEKLQAVLEAGGCAPHGLTLENRSFTALTGEKWLAEANGSVRKCLLSIPVTADMNPYIAQMIERAKDENANFMYGAPVFVIVSVNQDDPGAAVNCAAAMENMLLAAHGLGLGACWLNQLPRFAQMPPARELMDKLGLPKDHLIYATLALGYAADGPAPAAPESKSSYKIFE